MANLSTDTVKRLALALGSVSAANELANAINPASALVTQGTVGMILVNVITATSTSQTTDFASLQVNDQVIMIPATAGNADAIGPISTAGNLGQAAVVGNVYLVFRAFAAPAAVSITL